MRQIEALRAQYEKYPYPRVPLFAKVKREDSFLMSYESGYSLCYRTLAGAADKPKILIVGAGAFEPYVVAQANPHAEITAIDLSHKAMRQLRWRLLYNRITNVKILRGDFQELALKHGPFDMIVATGVLHHLKDRDTALAALKARLAPRGIMRLMLYSRHGRNGIYRWQEVVKRMGWRHHHELKKFVDTLNPKHPLKAQFYLYTDSDTDSENSAGMQDGFFHVCDKPFDAFEMEKYLANAGLEARHFLHSASGQPSHLEEYFARSPVLQNRIKALSRWQKIGLLDRLCELESNFIFWAADKATSIKSEILSFATQNPKRYIQKFLVAMCNFLLSSIAFSRRIFSPPKRSSSAHSLPKSRPSGFAQVFFWRLNERIKKHCSRKR
jgi:SAM-dependent methyltransferase